MKKKLVVLEENIVAIDGIAVVIVHPDNDVDRLNY